MGTRKRSAPFLLEKPLASRLRFDRELTECKHLPSGEQSCVSVDRSRDDHSCRSASLRASACSATVLPVRAEKREKLGTAAKGHVATRDAGGIEWRPWDTTREKRKGGVLGEATSADGDAESWSAIWGRAGPSLLGRGRGSQSESQAGRGREEPSETEAEAVDTGEPRLAIWSPSSCRLRGDYMRVIPKKLKSAPILSLKSQRIRIDVRCKTTNTKIRRSTATQPKTRHVGLYPVSAAVRWCCSHSCTAGTAHCMQ